jgi:hypothetical protein
MPITRREFDDTIDTLSAKVLEFLKSNPNDAFDIEELAEAVGGRQLEVWAILDALEQRKQVSGKCVKGTGYYCIPK